MRPGGDINCERAWSGQRAAAVGEEPECDHFSAGKSCEQRGRANDGAADDHDGGAGDVCGGRGAGRKEIFGNKRLPAKCGS